MKSFQQLLTLKLWNLSLVLSLSRTQARSIPVSVLLTRNWSPHPDRHSRIWTHAQPIAVSSVSLAVSHHHDLFTSVRTFITQVSFCTSLSRARPKSFSSSLNKMSLFLAVSLHGRHIFACVLAHLSPRSSLSTLADPLSRPVLEQVSLIILLRLLAELLGNRRFFTSTEMSLLNSFFLCRFSFVAISHLTFSRLLPRTSTFLITFYLSSTSPPYVMRYVSLPASMHYHVHQPT